MDQVKLKRIQRDIKARLAAKKIKPVKMWAVLRESNGEIHHVFAKRSEALGWSYWNTFTDRVAYKARIVPVLVQRLK